MKKYQRIVLDYIKENSFCMLKEKSGVFRHPFVVPGAGYESDLWDWDSFWSGYALLDIVELFGKDDLDWYAEKKEKVIAHLKGNILNFLENKESDGFIPGTITSGGIFATYFVDLHREGKAVNQCKPFLCASAFRISKYDNDTSWLSEHLQDLADYLDYYERHQKHKTSGLYTLYNMFGPHHLLNYEQQLWIDPGIFNDKVNVTEKYRFEKFGLRAVYKVEGV